MGANGGHGRAGGVRVHLDAHDNLISIKEDPCYLLLGSFLFLTFSLLFKSRLEFLSDVNCSYQVNLIFLPFIHLVLSAKLSYQNMPL